jgi:Tfp pilus assembly protein PilX
MSGDDQIDCSTARVAVEAARREAAAAMARLAEAAVRYAGCRLAEDTAAGASSGLSTRKQAKPGEFVADEVALMLREQPYTVRWLLARSRRLAADLPTIWEAFGRGTWTLSKSG